MCGLSNAIVTLTILLALAGSSTYGQSSRMPQARTFDAGENAKHKNSQLASRLQDQRTQKASPDSRGVKRTKSGHSFNNSREIRRKRPKVEKVAFPESTIAEVSESEPKLGCDSVTCNEFLKCKAKRGIDFCAPNIRQSIWGQAEYLRWWIKGMDTRALATTNPAGTSQADAGVLGAPGTSILFGGGELSDSARSGGRFTLGMWLDPCESRAVAVTYTGLEEKSDRLSASSDDFSILARPFFNAETGLEDSRLIAFPNLLQGTLSVEVTTEFQSGEVLLRRNRCRSCGSRVDYLFGYRFAELEDDLRISDSSTAISGPTVGATLDIFDQFATENQFHGGQIGIQLIRKRNPCWSFEFLAKVALGNTSFRGAVTGQTTATIATGDFNTIPVGLLTQSSNIGTHEDDEFSTLAELGVSLRRHLRYGLTATFGYTFMYWSEVLRAGEQIDESVNLSQIPPGTLTGPARPSFPFDTTSFWAQGLNFGLEYRF